jgi:hypothetical protein
MLGTEAFRGSIRGGVVPDVPNVGSKASTEESSQPDVDAARAEYSIFDRNFVPDGEADTKENDEYLFSAGERYTKRTKKARSKKMEGTLSA